MDKFKRAIPHLLVVAIVLSAQFLGMLTPILNFVTDWRFEATSRPASGEIVMVGIDPKSLDALGVWPWPRRVHAKLVEKLQAAGVAEIVFDVDFSSKTTPQDDSAFEAALVGAAGSVVLPVFRQTWAVGEAGKLKTTRPLDRFARYSWLASVGVLAQSGGVTRVFPFGDTIDGEFIPSIPAFLGGGTVPAGESFFVDYSIRPQTIKRVSYVDVLQGRVAAGELVGKKIIIGANAVELSDNFAVPVHGVVSGPMLQAISTESVIQNRALSQTSNTAPLAGVLVIILLVSLVFTRLGWRRRQLALMLLLFGIEGAALATQWLAPVIVDTSMWLVAIMAYIGITMMQEIDCRQLMETIARTQSKNTRAILDQVISDNFDGILIADQDGRIQTASRVAAQYLNLPAEQPLVGMELDKVLPASLAIQARAALDAIGRGGDANALSSTSEVEILRRDQSRLILDCVVTPSLMSNDASPTGGPGQDIKIITITFRDVTQIRQATRDMREAGKAAISANQAKTDFLATMS
ncbi:MAG: CHASE2 domain-containing protein, partial [Hyphomicrobiales bacterium]